MAVGAHAGDHGGPQKGGQQRPRRAQLGAGATTYEVRQGREFAGSQERFHEQPVGTVEADEDDGCINQPAALSTGCSDSELQVNHPGSGQGSSGRPQALQNSAPDDPRVEQAAAVSSDRLLQDCGESVLPAFPGG